MAAPSPDFSFPGTPYPVQTELMRAIHSAIDQRRIALLESPTGTGKTLSIICGALTWLRDNRYAVSLAHARDRGAGGSDGGDNIADDDDEPAWVVQQALGREQRVADDDLRRRKDAYRSRVRRAARGHRGAAARKKVFGGERAQGEGELSSGEEEEEGGARRELRVARAARVIFATRTHSQLAQFLEELGKTQFGPPAVMGENGLVKMDFVRAEREGEAFELPFSVVPFGSRKQFCINEEVRALEGSAAIAERCRELTEARAEPVPSAKRKRSRNRCPYKNAEAEAILRDKALVQIHSIEELGKTGELLGACPYYATRAALDTGDVDVIAVPYSAVLHAPTRRSLGLDIDEDTVVIFDEAHNIVNTVCDLHSSVLTRPALVETSAALKAYTSRYENRFTSENLFNLRQLSALCDGLTTLLPDRDAEDAEKKLPKPKVVPPSAMLFDAGVDNINMFSLVSFMEESKLSKKLRGFVDDGENDQHNEKSLQGLTRAEKEKYRQSRTSAQRSAKRGVAAFENFVRSVADCPPYGRVGLYPYRKQTSAEKPAPSREGASEDHSIECVARLKYFVTEPGQLFASNVGRARAVLMLGGTLSPRSAIKDTLLGVLHRDNILELECEHVVPADHVLTRVCTAGPSGAPLEFTFQRRQSTESFDELGKSVEKLVMSIPGGVVIFFSSYELLRQTHERWRENLTFSRLERMKPFFVETRGDNVAFEDYKRAVEQDAERGAVLAAVMGGKLSEGINFSDALGRAVVMVGMPFANATHIETGEMLKRCASASERSTFLENQCMTVVNQCIGRAVRHKSDYATILLMDRRYGRTRVAEKLPKFVRRDFGSQSGFSRVLTDVRDFFTRIEGSAYSK